MVGFDYILKKINSLCRDLRDAKKFDDQKIFEDDLQTLREVVRELSKKVQEERQDSAFFEGELEDKKEVKQEPLAHEEKEDSCDAVAEYKKRRQARKDGKSVAEYRKRRQNRLDAKDDDGRWITTENNHKVHLNEKGVPDKGNPFVVEAMSGEKKHTETTTIKHEGSVIGNRMINYKNPHVTEEERAMVKKAVINSVSYGRSYRGGFDRRAYFEAGKYLADTVKDRAKRRKKAKEEGADGKPMIEDIYDVLKDVRSFGAPEGFDKISVESDLSKERTDAILKEAMDRFPTEWYEGIVERGVKIFIHDAPGRGDFRHGYYDEDGAIHVFAREHPAVVKDLDLPNDELPDMGIVNTLAHELGHYMEWANDDVGIMMRKCLEDRTKKSEAEYLEPGYDTKPDSFFKRYMGKQYDDGSTEILSVLIQTLGYVNPFEQMTGKGILSDSKDNESLKFVLGVLGGL